MIIGRTPQRSPLPTPGDNVKDDDWEVAFPAKRNQHDGSFLLFHFQGKLQKKLEIIDNFLHKRTFSFT